MGIFQTINGSGTIETEDFRPFLDHQINRMSTDATG
jgi:hypothetical protein